MFKIYFSVVIVFGVQIDELVEIGVYVVIGFDVCIGVGMCIGFYVVIEGYIIIGCDNEIFQFVFIGVVLQDKKYVGEFIIMEIGDCNIICEFVIFNWGIVQDGGVICIGNDNWIMVYVYLVYDCQLGSYIILVNNVMLVGYVYLGDYVFLGGFIIVYQFCYIGVYVMIVFMVVVSQDVLFFVMVVGNCVVLVGINSEGLKCCGFISEQIMEIKCVYKVIYCVGLLLEEVKQ